MHPIQTLFSATALGNIERLRKCLDQHHRLADPSSSIGYFQIQQALLLAFATGVFEAARVLLCRESNLSLSGGPLVLAAGKSDEDSVELLLKKGADPDVPWIWMNNLPLKVAVDKNIRRMLLDKGGRSTLRCAIEMGVVDEVVRMLDRTEFSRGDQEFVEMAAQRNHAQIVIVLLSRGFHTSQRAFVDAVCTGNLELAKILKGNPDESVRGERPLHHAVRSLSTIGVEFLLMSGANKDLANDDGQIPVQVARTLKEKSVIQALEANHTKSIVSMDRQ
ncbi:hypothetical protein FE257_002208 [Aspergillus nanangensis]|uniref:Uncharacterized protein n=1 Tax=Aspergillus nanangensis TaxID=2582783 RepID=A0AAD4GP83_ASPNN|nr:hypothetical protein FE257_002208 [Aspergillus nanangensis]